MPRWLVATLVIAAALPVTLVAMALWSYPALAAALCAGCIGMERVEPHLVVDPAMPTADRKPLTRLRLAARVEVETALGPIRTMPTLVVCSSTACDARMGGPGERRGARAQTLTTPFGTAIRLGPTALDRTIISHELAHVRVHELVGLRRQITGDVPAWFDEGIATLVSRDPRHTTGACPAAIALPVSPYDWAAASGRDAKLYARAACAVRAWLAANGGMPGLRAALADGRPLP